MRQENKNALAREGEIILEIPFTPWRRQRHPHHASELPQSLCICIHECMYLYIYVLYICITRHAFTLRELWIFCACTQGLSREFIIRVMLCIYSRYVKHKFIVGNLYCIVYSERNIFIILCYCHSNLHT